MATFCLLRSLVDDTLLGNQRKSYKKFELMITRRAKAYSSSGSVGILVENWGVQAKLIYKYQILYLSRITIGPCSRR